MKSFKSCRWLLIGGLFPTAMLAMTAIATPRRDVEKAAIGVYYLKEVRPLLAQHCYQCHGPDEAVRKGKLRLDRKEDAFAERNSHHAIVPGDLDNSQVWERITTTDEEHRMPPAGSAHTLTKKQIDTLKAWIEQGAKWEEHWSLIPPIKPPVPETPDKSWVRDPIDAFVLARMTREQLKPEAEASREVWLRRVSFDLTGLPPTLAEIDEFLKDKNSNAYEKQVDRLLASPRYGERQAHEWLDLARYADTGGYQNDMPRNIWKWREWVINSFNSNMPFDQFTIEQLAGDLLPNATLMQKVATGFNRNHPTNSEAGEEEDEYRSAYVIDRVNTTATVFMGLTLACAQCHDHKYDPITQRDYYSFYSFFNNIKERDADFGNPKPSIPVPNADQEPRLAELKTRIEALKQRLDRDDPLVDAAQKEWEKKTLARIGKPVEWTTIQPSGMLSRNGSLLKLLDDGSILSSGTAPVKDTYDIMMLPGKKRITALRLEVIPDDKNPEKGLGRASDGRFHLSSIEIRHSTVSESQDPPPVYMSRAEADINQKPKEDPASFDMFPGSIESAAMADDTGGKFFGGGWSIVDDERKKPHEAVFIPLEILETNEASVLRFSLHHSGGFKFKSLIGRFRISYTEDNSIREQLLPAQTKLWSSIGPFPAKDVTKAYSTVFEPEKDIKTEPLDLKKNFKKVVLPVPPPPKPGDPKGKAAPPKSEDGKASTKPEAEKAPPMKPQEKPNSEPKEKQAETKKDDKPADSVLAKIIDALSVGKKTETPKDDKKATTPAKPEGDKPAVKPDVQKPKQENITWIEQPRWRDGSSLNLAGANSTYYLTRKINSTSPRTAMVQIDGPAGFKMWVNGVLVQKNVPDPPAAAPVVPPKPEAKPTEDDAKEATQAKAEGDADKPTEPDQADEEKDAKPEFEFDAMTDRIRSKTEKRFRIGLRQGENEIVVKVVLGGGPNMGGRPGFGGGGFTFNLTPEGDDVITHEVATALRLEDLEKDIVNFVGPLPMDDVPSTASDSKTTANSQSRMNEPKKVSLVGEIAAPPKAEEENKLSPSRRRQKVLREYYRSRIDSVGRIIAEELAKVKDEEKQVKREIPETLVMEELEKPRQAYIFKRGIYKNHGDKVDSDTPAVLFPLDGDQPRNRLGLARWLVSGRHPLTARVLVNRIWAQYFGSPLVRTAEDFGIRAELPSHPELLDYLATEIVDSKWDLKKLHKRIVLSATYRQAATASKEKLERDPENRFLARAPRMRLTAEMVRDNALSVSGLLFEKVGGESVKPVQPENAWKTVEGNIASAYKPDRGEKQYRRALYVYWKRGSPYPSMLNFDAVKRDSCTVTRAITTTPLQALTLLNDPAYVEFAKMLGQKMLKDREPIGSARDLKKPDEDRKRIAYGFRICTSRPPTEKEMEILTKLLNDQRAHFKADIKAAKNLLGVGEAKADATIDAVELAAWASVGNALLSLDATIHR